MTHTSFLIQLLQRDGKLVYGLYFEYNTALISFLKKDFGISWSQTHKCWYLQPDLPKLCKLMQHLKSAFGIVAEAEETLRNELEKMQLPPETDRLLQQLVVYLKTQRYSDRTIRVYHEILKLFFTFFRTKPVGEITEHDIDRFNNEYILHRKLSHAYQNQFVSALKLFFRHSGLEITCIPKMERPRSPRKLPLVLSPAEVEQLLLVIRNLKHKTMLALIYSAGLRRGCFLIKKHRLL